LTTLLAIDSATDALSLALSRGGVVRAIHRVMPRQHQQQLFACLEELLEGESVRAAGIDAVAYGRGPGSFTGLRIAASAAQGLAYSLAIPVVGVSTLETQVRTYLRREQPVQPGLFLSTLDARIGQLYAAFFCFDGADLQAIGTALIVEGSALRLPAEFQREGQQGVQQEGRLALTVIGSGFADGSAIPRELGPIAAHRPDILPEALDMLPAAAAILEQGGGEGAARAVPDYVQKRIGWKTLAEQGRSA
jgi:tRNA threonylcarbamoyladenosine biosynthesis protein TsaB